MFMIFILIRIEFNIDINNDELLIIVWKHNKKIKSSLVVRSNVKPKFKMKETKVIVVKKQGYNKWDVKKQGYNKWDT
jgi:hypothetical protein